MLKHWGCQSVAVNSARKAVGALQATARSGRTFDGIIVDYQMPEFSGEHLVHAIGKRSAYNQIPIIMISSVDSGDLRHRMDDLGIDSFMTKPVRAKILKTILHKFIAKAHVPGAP